MNTFKNFARAALIVAALGTASASAAAAEPVVAADKASVSAPVQSRDGMNRRVRIHNNTGWTMLRFYASDSRITSWQEDMLGRGTLAAGNSIMMNIDDGSGACLYDFKGVFDDGDEVIQNRINVCEIESFRFTEG